MDKWIARDEANSVLWLHSLHHHPGREEEVEYEEVDNRTRHNSRSGSSFTQRGVAMACCGALNFFYCIIAGVRHPQYKCNTLQYLTISSHAILWHRNPAAIGQTSIIPIQYLAIFSCVISCLSNQ